MGSTKGVQPSWRLATITMATIPNASCHQRFPADVANGMSAMLDAVTAASPVLLLALSSRGWEARDLLRLRLVRTARCRLTQVSPQPANIGSTRRPLPPG